MMVGDAKRLLVSSRTPEAVTCELSIIDEPSRLLCRVATALPDGDLVWYRLAIDICPMNPSVPTAREATPGTLLPAACLERHIMPDGSFCLGAAEFGLPRVEDAQSAAQWWFHVQTFLALQTLAGLRGRFHLRDGLPHGGLQSLRVFEQLTEGLPDAVVDLLWEIAGGGASRSALRAPCVCGSGVSAASCHPPLRLALRALDDVHAAHRRKNVDAAQDRPCCGSLATCGVAIARRELGLMPERVSG